MENKDSENFKILKTVKDLGLKDFERLLEEWSILSENKKTLGGKPILPNLYVLADRGILFAPFAQELAEFLEAKKIMPFYGKTRSYSFQLTYPSKGIEESNDPFPALRDLYRIVHKDLTYYDKPYQGILIIDITEWVSRGASHEESFQAFLAFMGSLDDDTLAVFVSHESNEKKNAEMAKVIASRMRLKSLKFQIHSEEWGLSVLRDCLLEEGLRLSDEAAAFLKESVKLILLSPGNEGETSLQQLALDIAYGKYISIGGNSGVVEKNDVLSYGPTSEWISNFKSLRRERYGLMEE
jgi:hypothetical protein